MNETGIVAVFTGVRKPFQLREFPVPRPEPGAILVEVRLANVCGSDLHIWRGDYDVSRGQSEPFCLSIGHEMVGRIAALGEGVTHDWAGEPLAVGDRVAYQYFCPCGECRSCRKGRTPRCSQGHRYRSPPTEYPHFNAAYGQYYYLRKPQAVFKVPDNVPDVLAGPANCALSQVIDGLERAAAGPGDSLVIQGAGGLGINAIAVAKERGVSQVIVIDGIDSRLELAHEFGADVTIDLKEFNTPQARVRRVRELTEGEGADVVMELVGSPAVVAEGIEMLCNGGIVPGDRQHQPAADVRVQPGVDRAWRENDPGTDVVSAGEPAAGAATFEHAGRAVSVRQAPLAPVPPFGDRRGLSRAGRGGRASGRPVAVGLKRDMARCEQGYLCEVCGDEVEDITESDLYLRYVIGEIDARSLLSAPERHIRCNPVQAQFIVADEFEPVVVEGPFAKGEPRPGGRPPPGGADHARLATLQEIKQLGIPVSEYPLPDVWSENGTRQDHAGAVTSRDVEPR